MRSPRRLFFWILLTCAGVACASQERSPQPAPSSQPTTDEVVAYLNDPLTKQFFEAARKGDKRAMIELVNGGLVDRYPRLPHDALSRAIPAAHEPPDDLADTLEFMIRNDRVGLLERLPAPMTPGALLWQVASSGDVKATNVLLEAGVRPDNFTIRMTCPRDWTDLKAGRGDPLSHFIMCARPDSLYLLRRAGFPLSIFHACAIGDDDRVAELIREGANINSPAYASPLAIAAREGHLSVVELLLKAGAKPTPDIMEGGDENWLQLGSPLQMAAAGGHVNVVKRLLDAGADAHQPLPRKEQTLVEYLREESQEKSAHPNWPAIIQLLEQYPREPQRAK